VAWNEKQVVDLLRQVKVPGVGRDIIEYGVVQGVGVRDEQVAIEMEVLTKDPELPKQLEREVHSVLSGVGLQPQIDLKVKQMPNLGGGPSGGGPRQAPAQGPHGTSSDPWADRQALPGVKHIIAVASGKGGVGKSTVAVNLAFALRERGIKSGLLDADIYGPSAPIMLGIQDIEPVAGPDKRILPIESHGLPTISMGYLVHDDQPVIWRGPLVMKTIEQFLRGVAWEDLDVLVVDLPPGTGDAQLSLVQKVPLDGALIVTTPQDLALADVVRGQAMFEKVDVPTLGVVENMSYFICPNCDTRHELFAHGGGHRAAEQRNLRFFGEIPLDPIVRECGDHGKPIMVADPGHPQSAAFLRVADRVAEVLGLTPA